MKRIRQRIRRALKGTADNSTGQVRAGSHLQLDKTTTLSGSIATGAASASAEGAVSEAYWSDHNVTTHRVFGSAAESLAYFDWRNDQYPGYIDLMPVSGRDGEVVVDFGCGPGNDLVGFATFSQPAKLIAMDVSGPSLAEADARLRLHGGRAELVKIGEHDERIPLPDESVDYLHCSGVLMTVIDPLRTLREFRRVLKKNAKARLMVYNYDSVWVHLYAAHILRTKVEAFRAMAVTEVFARSTDGAQCPINRCWTVNGFLALCREAGFAAAHVGNAISLWELSLLPQRFEAMQSVELPAEHRKFLIELEFDRKGFPHWRGQVAGIDGCYELIK
jgi:ubiquinone/menaquinone biosynthesis C-methylase UbiE